MKLGQPPRDLGRLGTAGRHADGGRGVAHLAKHRCVDGLTTCQALEGQTLVGAYEIDGSKIRMSPLAAEESTLSTVIEIEKPSMITTRVTIRGRELEVRQRVTSMRGGMDGENMVKAFAPKNTTTVNIPRAPAPSPEAPRPAPPPPPKAPEPPRDQVLELLKEQGK